MTTFQKSVKYIALVFATCLAIFIITGVLDTVIRIVDGINDKDLSTTASYTYENISSLDIDMGVGNIIFRSEGTDFIVNANDVWGFEISESDGSLKIRSGSKNFLSGDSDSTLEIIVPKDCILEDLNIEVGVGECKIDGINTTHADLDSGVGEIICNGFSAKSCRVNAGVGDVEINFAESSDEYSILLDRGIGSAKINGETYSESRHKNSTAKRTIDLDCGIGEIELNFND